MEALRDVISAELKKIGKENKNLIVIDCDMGTHTRMKEFFDTFPKQSFQMGICEQNAMSVASGIAQCGKISVISTFSSFLVGRAWEQIRHSVVYNNSNVKLIGTHAGLSDSDDGGTHQCIEDFSLMMCIPKIEVFAPAFKNETIKIMKHIIETKTPAYIRVGRSGIVETNDKFEYNIGEPIELFKGKNIALISTGEITHEVIRAKKELEKHNLNCEVIHISSLRPLNEKSIVKLLKDMKYIYTIEEHSIHGGLGSIIAQTIIGKTKCIEFKTLGMKEIFGQSGDINCLRRHYGLDYMSITNIVLESIERRKSI